MQEDFRQLFTSHQVVWVKVPLRIIFREMLKSKLKKVTVLKVRSLPWRTKCGIIKIELSNLYKPEYLYSGFFYAESRLYYSRRWLCRNFLCSPVAYSRKEFQIICWRRSGCFTCFGGCSKSCCT